MFWARPRPIVLIPMSGGPLCPGGFDIAIRRGNATEAAWPGHRAVRVIEDIDTLIASPALLKQRPIKTPADIEGHLLLASETRAGDWTDWLDTAGLPHLVGHPRQTFDHFFVTRQAVEDGLGIGIGPLPMLAIDIAGGRLATPLPEIQVRRMGYVAVVPDHVGRMPIVGLFIDWLVHEGHPQAPTTPAGQLVLEPAPRDSMTGSNRRSPPQIPIASVNDKEAPEK